MRYMLSIYGKEAAWETATPEDIRRTLAAYEEFGREVHGKDAFVAGDGLQSSTTATTVRVRDGETLVTDGPFAETKEQLGGYYVLECADLDEAIAWAAKIPGALTGTIEVRPVMDYEAVGSTDHYAAEARS